MEKYVCAICGHVYDPLTGESAQNIAAGISFEKLPGGWECPVCGAGKTSFQKA